MPVYVALLRGINVGGKNKLPMKDLATAFERVGCADVQTYINSGNVLFTASASAAERVPTAVVKQLHKDVGLTVPVVMRSAAELAAVAAHNPFLAEGGDEDHQHVAFLASVPDKKRAAALDPERSPPDRFRLRGRDLYLSLPNGVARSRITNAWLDAQLATTSTLRNWRTVKKLLELAAGSAH